MLKKNLTQLTNKNSLNYDIYERHRKVAEYINDSETVLDVGGELNHLSQFLKSPKIIVANLNTGDVIIKKGQLPFKENSFDVVCSIDVLEHVPENERIKFIKDLIRVATNKVIISFPAFTQKHEEYEKKTLNVLKGKGVDIQYLKEHVENGLPKTKEIINRFKNIKTEVLFSGNLNINYYLFKYFLFDPKIKYLRSLNYLVKKIFYFVTNPLFYKLLSNKQYSESINRAYIIFYK